MNENSLSYFCRFALHLFLDEMTTLVCPLKAQGRLMGYRTFVITLRCAVALITLPRKFHLDTIDILVFGCVISVCHTDNTETTSHKGSLRPKVVLVGTKIDTIDRGSSESLLYKQLDGIASISLIPELLIN